MPGLVLQVEENSSERMGLDILTASKSFTVLCLDETDKAAWKELLQVRTHPPAYYPACRLLNKQQQRT